MFSEQVKERGSPYPFNSISLKRIEKTILLNLIMFFEKRVLVRSPRFEPGSSAWQADVLDQTRLRPHFRGFCWSRDLWRLCMLFKFFEKANALLVHHDIPALYDKENR